ncbi:MAG: PhoH family protein, partial [Candidatus Marinimicrobia bacterium]|nr:PhoH family protein [Candidatus Neomarinimicrobiota bacterium]
MLFGHHEIFLRQIEENFESKIVARGDRLSVEGPVKDVDMMIRLLQDLVTRIGQGEYISEQYLHYAITMIQENGKGPAESISHDDLLTGLLKKIIKPKTVGQTEYIEAIEKNDVVFSIGPAGTGKTYLAVAEAVAHLKAKKVNRIA